MQIHTDIATLPAFTRAVVTIGTFDGVHQGHRKIIAQLIETAATVQGESVIITFHPHPRKVVSSHILGVRLINTLEERIALLAALQVDHVVIIPFTDAFANQSPEDYVAHFLVNKFKPHTIIIGYDHRFGKGRAGDYRLMEAYSEKYNYQLKEIPKHVLEDIAISATKIREAILSGDIATANQLLGYDFFFEGVVVHGDKLGRQLGYPTANIKITNEEKIAPADGIYAVHASLTTSDVQPNDPIFKGMMSVGFRPTVDGKKRVIEVNIFDFDKNIYDQSIRVFIKHFLRKEEKFNSLEALVQQIDKDKENSLLLLDERNS